MFIVNNYPLAVLFCIVTMLCWGSWGNTQKMAARTWRYELFYWDYTIGMLLFSLLAAFTLGSFGSEGRSFLTDIAQVETGKMCSALLGGVIFNASNILLSASVSIAGMAVAFPLGVGIALVLGVVVNYIGAPKGDPVLPVHRCGADRRGGRLQRDRPPDAAVAERSRRTARASCWPCWRAC